MHLVPSHVVRNNTKLKAAPLAAEKSSGLAAWLLATWRRYAGDGCRRPARRAMRHIETLALGGKRQLFLVECAGERFLVGSGAESVQTIVRVRPEVVSKANAAMGERP